MKLTGLLTRLGSRPLIVGEIASVIMLAKSCAAPPPPCEGEDCGTGGSVASTSSSGGSGGEETSGTGATGGGGDATGGSGAGGTGGAGGSTVSSGGAGGTGTGGSGGCPVYECGEKDCGLVDNGCEAVADCGGCGEQLGDPNNEGPMTCSVDHVCECAPQGNTPEAMALCDGTVVQVVGTAEYCASKGGCNASLCGAPPVPKVPDSCRYGGALADETQIWCCAIP